MIYFDNAATTAPYPEVLQTYQEVASKLMGNPSSLHDLGVQAKRLLEASRQQVASLLGKSAEEIFFTSGGTESDNWAIKGLAFEKAVYGKHLIVSAIEHPAVKESAKWLQAQGFDVDLAPVTKHGFVDLEALENLLRPDTILVSVMAVNNEIGAIQPIKAIAQLLENRPTIAFHVDAVQAIGKLPIADILPQRVDFASFSSHKFHGVRGVGFLYKKQGKKISPLLTGGGQEANLRSTTENLPGIAATAKALRLTLEQVDQPAQMQELRDYLLEELASFPDVTVFSGRENFAPNIVTFGLKGLRGEVLVHALEEEGIYVSTTSACSSKAGKPAGTLLAMGFPLDLAQTAVRVSFDGENQLSQVEAFVGAFKQIYQQTRKVRV
ncbi:cysteine desulfurase family protein [Streptococcus cuniculipharyngis]|uniref:Cysteine desulfurase n=1 Tax=Streptococcus cuniculipharyngis TaxID=1562651 RepID=A0A5C5SFL8_9STRE|nr:cysteine desulfurase family protein [Streptococcus cuniculipharyngis]TWS99092.1 cysteine desulfurase [Streptococcus cuniculipharyngis]